MADSEGTALTESSGSRQWGRTVLVVLIAVAVVFATGLTPALGSLTGGTPASQFVPVPENPQSQAQAGGGQGSGAYNLSGQPGSTPESSSQQSGDPAKMGALSAGKQASVGGSLAAGNDTYFRSLNDEVHFVATSEKPRYWRTNAYDQYTGGGWEQSGSPEPYSPPIQESPRGDRISYAIELQQAATSLPTVWTPQYVESGAELFVTPTTSIVTGNAVPAGTRYQGVSYRPPRDPDILKTADGSTPSQIERQYTQLPNESRAALQPLASNLTANTTSRYEAAKRIETWLESSKSYSLSVSAPPSDGVARQFVYEMDEGYCEYFATSMTTMLRSEGIPARYVVGYAPGERTGQDEYTVRAMHAHAWVEVYFDGVGWVRFDPTPASERQSQEAQAAMNQGSSSYQAASTDGSPTNSSSSSETSKPGENDSQSGEQTTSGSTTTTAPTATTTTTTTETTGTTSTTATTTTTTTTTTTSSDETEQSESSQNETKTESEGPAPLNVSLNREPVPGARVVVTVTRNNSAVADASVLFNGEPVGRTGENGTVEGIVPYTEQLDISVRTLENPPELIGGMGTNPGFASVQPARNNSSESYSLDTDATVAVLGRTVTANEVRLLATIDGVPVRNATVTMDGEAVARTNASGATRVTLPSEPGEAMIRVQRGAVNGTHTVDLPRLNISANSTAPLALPFTEVTIRADMNGSGVTGVPIRVNGEKVGTTGPDGTLTTRLPLAATAVFELQQFGQQRSTRITGLYKNTGLVGGALALVGILVLYGRRRTGVTGKSLLETIVSAAVRTLRWLVDTILVVAVGLAGWVSRSLVRLKDALLALVATLQGKLSPRVLAARFVAWLRGVRRQIVTATESVKSSFQNVQHSLQTDSDGTRQSDYRTFRDAWATFLAYLSVRTPDRYTPGELAEYAVREDGLPADAVETLRDEFRAVEYGRREPSARLERVEAASQAIEAAKRPDDEVDADEGGED
ncbi:transglutaminase TgpA family protein [Halobacterium wangiae]|uniref:transglutaminase TgpA family protein n=1 Tax=Halobacterium wangiae TaxID=2902623 RepID=UPI001E343F69|nr:transglutaminaseTgpA domain-containing protein [Halobacterium wangiae]